jgi:hypothetical protein
MFFHTFLFVLNHWRGICFRESYLFCPSANPFLVLWKTAQFHGRSHHERKGTKKIGIKKGPLAYVG